MVRQSSRTPRVRFVQVLAWISALVGVAASRPALAVPDLSSVRPVGSLRVIADHERPDVFYVVPADPALARRPDGRPDFSLVSLRYTGRSATADRGLVLHRTVLSLRLVLPAHDPAELERVARLLAAGGRRVELRPLPIRRIESALVYASLAGPDSARRALPAGRMAVPSAERGDAAWSERVLTVALDSLTAQAMHAALARGQLALSAAFAFVADGRPGAAAMGAITGSGELGELLRERLAAAGDSATRDSAISRVISAGAIRLGVDLREWPDAVRRVDVDGQVPAGFACLDVYCFDFRDGRRPDLHERRVEVEAETVGGRMARQEAVFARERPDVLTIGLRFPVAVRTDRNFRYRVTDVRPDGTSSTGAWQPGRGWLDLLDITSPVAPVRGVRSIR